MLVIQFSYLFNNNNNNNDNNTGIGLSIIQSHVLTQDVDYI
jgi:hypothetical protein